MEKKKRKQEQNRQSEILAFQALVEEIARWKKILNVDHLRFQIGEWTGLVSGVERPDNSDHGDFILCDSNIPVFYISHKAKKFGWNGYGRLGSKELLSTGTKHRDPRFRGWAHYVYVQLAAELKSKGLPCPWHLSWHDAGIKGFHTVPPPDLAALIVYGPHANAKDSAGSPDFTPLIFTGAPEVVRCKEGENVLTIRSKDGIALVYPALPTGENAVWLTAHDRVGTQGAPKYINANTYFFKDRDKSFAGWLGAFPERERMKSISNKRGKMSQSKLVKYPGKFIERYCSQIGLA